MSGESEESGSIRYTGTLGIRTTRPSGKVQSIKLLSFQRGGCGNPRRKGTAGCRRVPPAPGAPRRPPRAPAWLLETSCARGAVRCDRAPEAVAMSALPGSLRGG